MYFFKPIFKDFFNFYLYPTLVSLEVMLLITTRQNKVILAGFARKVHLIRPALNRQ
jgi:hypothetical protein